MVTRSELN